MQTDLPKLLSNFFNIDIEEEQTAPQFSAKHNRLGLEYYIDPQGEMVLIEVPSIETKFTFHPNVLVNSIINDIKRSFDRRLDMLSRNLRCEIVMYDVIDADFEIQTQVINDLNILEEGAITGTVSIKPFTWRFKFFKKYHRPYFFVIKMHKAHTTVTHYNGNGNEEISSITENYSNIPSIITKMMGIINSSKDN
jgi:hypothetical protein